MKLTNGGKTIEVSTFVSWLVSAVATLAMAFGTYVLSDVKDDIEALSDDIAMLRSDIKDENSRLDTHLLNHPDTKLDLRLTQVEDGLVAVKELCGD